MDNDEYKDFLISIFEEFVQPRITKLQSHYNSFKDFPIIKSVIERPSYPIHNSKEIMEIANYATNYCETDSEILKIFKKGKLERMTLDSLEIISNTRTLAEKSGFLDALDQYFETIVRGLRLDYLPQHDFEVLHNLQNKDPKTELNGAIYELKSQQSSKTGIFLTLPLPSEVLLETEYTLRDAAYRISKSEDEDKSANGPMKRKREESEEPPKQTHFIKRVFNGLKKVIPGACIFASDMAIIFAASQLQLHDALSYGSMASSALGSGKIFEGHRTFSREQRLLELSRLKNKGLISDRVYKQKEDEIMGDL